MRNLTNVIQSGDLKRIGQMLARLSNMPEFGMWEMLRSFRRLVSEAQSLEERANKEREKALEEARRLVAICQNYWTEREMEDVLAEKITNATH